jgi:hypothetical protein
MAKRGENHPEDLETKEEREARVEEMLVRARRAHRAAPKKKAPRKSQRDKKKTG